MYIKHDSITLYLYRTLKRKRALLRSNSDRNKGYQYTKSVLTHCNRWVFLLLLSALYVSENLKPLGGIGFFRNGSAESVLSSFEFNYLLFFRLCSSLQICVLHINPCLLFFFDRLIDLFSVFLDKCRYL